MSKKWQKWPKRKKNKRRKKKRKKRRKKRRKKKRKKKMKKSRRISYNHTIIPSTSGRIVGLKGLVLSVILLSPLL